MGLKLGVYTFTWEFFWAHRDGKNSFANEHANSLCDDPTCIPVWMVREVATGTIYARPTLLEALYAALRSSAWRWSKKARWVPMWFDIEAAKRHGFYGT